MPVTFPGDPLDMELEKAIHIFSNGEPVGATIRVLQTYSNIIHIFFSQFEINSNDLVVNRYNFMMTHHHLPSFPTSHPGCGKPTKNVGHFPRGNCISVAAGQVPKGCVCWLKKTMESYFHRTKPSIIGCISRFFIIYQ